MNARSLLLFVVGSALGAVLSIPAGAATWHVVPDGSGDFPTIQAAIDAADDGDVIQFAPGVFTGEGNRNIDGLGKAITIRGSAADPGAFVIDCQGSNSDRARGFYFHLGESISTVVEGLTVRGGYAPALPDRWGGAILCHNSSVTIRDCRFEQNEAGWGGGLLFWGSSSIVERVRVADNIASTNGSGIYCTTGDVSSFNYVTVVGNVTPGRGGAFVANACSPEISNSTFHGNDASTGAFWVIGDSNLWISNSIVTGNDSSAFDCDSGSVNLSCTDIFGNFGNWTSCIAGQLGLNGNLSADPQYCDAGARDFTLTSSSPCAPNDDSTCGLIGAWPVACDPVPEGACCDLLTGDCIIAIEEVCSLGGPRYEFQGPSTSCDPNPCPVPTGACCLQDATCEVLTEDDCAALEGWYRGSGVNCEPHLCSTASVPTASGAYGLVVGPNPTTGAVEISLRLTTEQAASVVVLDATGRQVVTLVSGIEADEHRITWDGKDRDGHDAPSGVYFVQVATKESTESRRIALVR